MRVTASLLLMVACYAPKVPGGAPCDPAAPSCPSGQMCLATGICSSSALPVDGAVDTGPDAQSAFAYRPSIVACINPAAPNLAACATAAGGSGISVDGSDAGHTWDGFVRVRVGSAWEGRTVVGLRLQLTAMDTAAAPSDNAGDVYTVASFTTASLGSAEPAKTDPMPIATSPGSVAALQTVEWRLPIALAVPNANLYLELESTSTNGVDYWDLAGTTPPQLIVDVQ